MQLRTVLALALAATISGAGSARAQTEDRHVVRIVVDGAISPASAEFIRDGIDEAADGGASAFVIVLDTPGGLVESTRRIVQAMIGGAIFNLANILLVAAIAIAGLAIAFPVSIGTAQS